MLPLKCLKVADGIIALIAIKDIKPDSITEEDVSIHIADYGLMVKIKNIEIPIPESLIGYFIQNRTITIYPLSEDNYVEEPLFSITIASESLIEAKGIYNFWKSNVMASPC